MTCPGVRWFGIAMCTFLVVAGVSGCGRDEGHPAPPVADNSIPVEESPAADPDVLVFSDPAEERVDVVVTVIDAEENPVIGVRVKVYSLMPALPEDSPDLPPEDGTLITTGDGIGGYRTTLDVDPTLADPRLREYAPVTDEHGEVHVEGIWIGPTRFSVHRGRRLLMHRTVNVGRNPGKISLRLPLTRKFQISVVDSEGGGVPGARIISIPLPAEDTVVEEGTADDRGILVLKDLPRIPLTLIGGVEALWARASAEADRDEVIIRLPPVGPVTVAARDDVGKAIRGFSVRASVRPLRTWELASVRVADEDRDGEVKIPLRAAGMPVTLEGEPPHDLELDLVPVVYVELEPGKAEAVLDFEPRPAGDSLSRLDLRFPEFDGGNDVPFFVVVRLLSVGTTLVRTGEVAEGPFRIDLLPPGETFVLAQAPLHGKVWHGTVNLKAGETRTTEVLFGEEARWSVGIENPSTPAPLAYLLEALPGEGVAGLGLRLDQGRDVDSGLVLDFGTLPAVPMRLTLWDPTHRVSLTGIRLEPGEKRKDTVAFAPLDNRLMIEGNPRHEGHAWIVHGLQSPVPPFQVFPDSRGAVELRHLYPGDYVLLTEGGEIRFEMPARGPQRVSVR